MATEAGHIQISEFSRDVIPQINWMMEDLFCQYGVSIPYFMLDYEFPDYSQRPDWVTGYSFNLDWGEWGYWLPWFNELLGLLWDEAHLPRLTLPDWSLPSVTMFNDYTEILYDNQQTHYVYGQSGTFTKDEVIEGEDSGVTGYYKWKDGDGYIHVANKSAADFEDEKIVGADSGAYAWTYEDYVYYTTYTRTQFEDCNLVRRGLSFYVDFDDAWDIYQNDPTWIPWGEAYITPRMYVWKELGSYGWIYHVNASKGFIMIDTTLAEASPSSVTLRIYIDDVIDTIGEGMTLRTFLYDFGDTVDSSDWSGGTLIDDTTVITTSDEDSWVEISLGTDDLNIGGWSKYRLSLKVTDDNVYPGEVDEEIRITNAQLKLGYNE